MTQQLRLIGEGKFNIIQHFNTSLHLWAWKFVEDPTNGY